jgi:hypothetical protein
MKPKQSLRRSSRFRRAFNEFFVALTAISWGDIAMAPTKEQIETHNKAVVQAGFKAWNAGTGQPYDLLAQRKLAIVGHSAAASGRRDGKPYANTYSWFLDLRDGKIVKHSPSSTASRSTSSGNASSRSLEIRQVSLIKAYCVAACAGGTTLTYRTFSDSLTRERVFDA